ncbi:hypothetical protein RhiirC2_89672 [Rhizophagus irregularis]|uniref:Uncharacterized protein n=1 Tax=Rhizophagus irregularis TaxID=588596 RepID=A0A2N1MT33_9GLOM|nr:hypothetical protein RhiirC2_89672 [Rhizophagus irregularis]
MKYIMLYVCMKTYEDDVNVYKCNMMIHIIFVLSFTAIIYIIHRYHLYRFIHITYMSYNIIHYYHLYLFIL